MKVFSATSSKDFKSTEDRRTQMGSAEKFVAYRFYSGQAAASSGTEGVNWTPTDAHTI
jgi:hypothetical protein